MQNETLEGFMLSVHQQHLWSLQQDSLAYHAQCTICLEGNINTQIVEKSLQKIISRHGIFRTNFCRKAGIKMPIQVIHDKSNILCNYVNLSQLSAKEQSEKIEEISQEERCFILQLDKNSLLRSYLLTLSANKQILLLTMPSLYADRWTLKNLLQEISDTYATSLKGEELSDEPLQYVQFCEWQNELITEEDAETGRAYWQQQKLWKPPTLTLPFEGEHSGQKRFEPDVHTLSIDPDIFTQIKALTTLYNTTIAEFLFACWQTLFWRITGHSNIVISTVFSGRKYEELHEVMGLLAKWLPVRCPFQEDFKFTEVLSQIGETLGNHHKWQEYFLWEESAKSVVETVDLPVSFEFEEWPNQYDSGGVSFSLDKQYVCFDPFKVKLTCVHRKESLTVEFHYNTELICQESIQSLEEQFKTLVESAANNPQAKVNELEILNPSERQRLLVELNSTQTNYTQDKCIQHLFEKQVEKTPDNIAVVFEDQQLSYHQLNKCANQLAHYLQQLGVGPEVLVAICLERSAEIVIALLAVLKAGGAYLPIDPALPTQGLTFRLQDTQAPVLLTQQSLLERLPELATRVVCLDPSAEVISQKSATNPIANLTTENLAYVLYTSGSTGFPKGVAIEHRQILNYLYAILDKLELTDGGASFATVSTIAADLGNTAIFSTLCTGGCLHIISQERASDPKALGEYFHRYPIDFLKIVPSHLRTLLASSPTQSILPRQRLILGGEAASWDLIEQIQQQALECQILNHYGPTETTVGVTTFAVNGIASHNEKTVPIGRPLANTQIYVLDKKMLTVPIGVPGDLYISGSGLARGYLNRPELTSEKFIPNPFSDQPGSRLYKTGDLVRYFSDGNLEFLRRIDNQVKIRGYRIELEEIEMALGQHPGVRQVVVIDREDEPGNKCLVSYVLPQPGQALNIVTLRSFLREKLPEYMLPSAFVVLKSLPLNPNGKVDRQALPAPHKAQPELEEAFVAPRTPIEEVLAGIWIQILSISSVGIHNNFFDLGGHSLLATQVISQVREAFQIELPLLSLFESPTVAELAEHIDLAMKAGQRLEAPPIKRVSQEAELPLSFAQARLWFLNQLQPDSSTYNMWATISLTGILNITALAQSLNEIVRRHAILRTTFASSAGQPVQRVAPNLGLVFPVVDLQHFPYTDRPFEVDRLATQEARQPFDLVTGPLVRVTLLRLAEAEHVILLTMHHIVSDGWSTGVLIRELATLYKAFLTGQPSLLPELPIQYTDFAVWQRRWLTGEVLESQLAYWRQHLEGAVPMLLLPTDRPRPSVQTFRGARQSFSLSTHLSERLKTLSRQERVTLFMTLLAAFKILLHRYSGQDDIVVGSPIANRNRTEIEGLIGFFVNTLVLRTQLSGNPSFRQLLGRVKEVALGAYNHQDLPFEYLVEVLQPERNLSHNPLFQVMFVLQNSLREELKFPDLSLQSVEKESRIAKFDLTLSMVDSESGLVGALEYNTDLFNASTITRMLGHFQTLLEGIVANPEQHLLQLPFLTTPERQQLLVEWNDTQADYPKDQCIHQLFEIQVEHTPDAVAVVFESEQLTYCELNARANQLAHHLRTLGVEPEVLVGIYVERSLDMVIGLLGILKAGGAYVPLDPTYPQKRLAFILEDAQVPVLLTQGRLVEAMPQHKAKVICLDTDWQTIAQESKENSVSEVTANNLAYVIYTSGSTGRPKGVMIKHQSTVAMLDWAKQIFAAEALLGVLASTSICFDLSVFEIFVPLNNGGKVILVENALHLPTLPTAKNVTLINTVPSIIAELLRTDGISASVHTINIAGEPLQNQLVQQLHRWDNIQQVFNLYGPSEYTTYSTVALIQKGTSNIPPIGGPINNTQVYLLDQKSQLVPVGVLGELYIGGDGLARGYLNRPELTAEKFIPNPFTDKSAARLYKTGDLARYLPNGDIEYIGRIDYQVKIRGFRIELSEIEVVLSQHPDVLQNVIIVREDSPGDQRLVAYLVVKQESAPTLNNLRRFLTQQLPKYMIPSAWVLLEALPLTPNGKVNRQALPVPNQARPKLEVAHEAPKTDLERTILKVWQEVLHVEEIGIHDNFFDLGGHSLLLVEVHEKLRKMLKLDFYMVVMFQYPTINSLAKHFCHGQSEQFDLHQSDDGQENRIALRKHRKQIRQEHRAGEK